MVIIYAIQLTVYVPIKTSINDISDVHRIPKVDVVFALSSTSKDSLNTYTTMNQAIQSIMTEYGIKKLRYSLITFDSLQDLRLSFNTKFASKYNTANFVNNLLYTLPTGEANLQEALLKAKQQFDILKGHRVDAQKVVVVLIDKSSVSSKEDLQRVVDQYERDKIKIVPVLIGDEVSSSDVLLIASDKDKKNVVVTTTQEKTERLGKMIMDLVYKG